MSTPWALFNEVNKNNTRDYFVYRCPDPVATETGRPWYQGIGTNICPCDPKLSNPSGRGFTACPIGINQESNTWKRSAFQMQSQLPEPSAVTGNLYNEYQFVPPQLQPRELIRIGQSWRSSN